MVTYNLLEWSVDVVSTCDIRQVGENSAKMTTKKSNKGLCSLKKGCAFTDPYKGPGILIY